jgi:hypothetical protein
VTATGQIGQIVAFTARLAAATNEATEQQKADLTRRIIPIMKTRPLRIDRAEDELLGVMGRDWHPVGELDVTPASALSSVYAEAESRGIPISDLFSAR